MLKHTLSNNRRDSHKTTIILLLMNRDKIVLPLIVLGIFVVNCHVKLRIDVLTFCFSLLITNLLQ